MTSSSSSFPPPPSPRPLPRISSTTNPRFLLYFLHFLPYFLQPPCSSFLSIVSWFVLGFVSPNVVFNWDLDVRVKTKTKNKASNKRNAKKIEEEVEEEKAEQEDDDDNDDEKAKYWISCTFTIRSLVSAHRWFAFPTAEV